MRLKLSPDYGFKPNLKQLAAIQRHDSSAVVWPEDHTPDWMRGTLKDDLHCDPVALYQDPELVDVRFCIEGGTIETSNMLTILHEVQNALNRVAGLAIPATEQARTQLLNERCNVHVPGLGLLIIDEVEVETDCCTQALQRRLDEGWRILAVCPQPDKRRPDYVLGRKAEKMR